MFILISPLPEITPTRLHYQRKEIQLRLEEGKETRIKLDANQIELIGTNLVIRTLEEILVLIAMDVSLGGELLRIPNHY